jgi:uncharacterized protein (TIGR03066 family)
MKQVLGILMMGLVVSVVGCGGDSPTGPGSDLVGTWINISDSADSFDLSLVDAMMEFSESGSLVATIRSKDGSLEINIEGTWSIVGDNLVLTNKIDGETEVSKGQYSINGRQMTIVYDNGTVEVYRRS